MSKPVISTDLRSMFGPVRDQGARPTCLAFAASDAHAALRSGWTPLSCEYLFYHAQKRVGRPPTIGATLSAILDALLHDGQPEEAGWEYLQAIPPDIAQWHPPVGITPVFRRVSDRKGNTIDQVINEVGQGRPVLILMTLSTSFYSASADGVVIFDPNEQPDIRRRHAVIAVGHGTIDGQRTVLIRNSWGATWGDSGYAWLTEEYLLPRAFALAVLLEDPDVSPGAAAA